MISWSDYQYRSTVEAKYRAMALHFFHVFNVQFPMLFFNVVTKQHCILQAILFSIKEENILKSVDILLKTKSRVVLCNLLSSCQMSLYAPAFYKFIG
ncbi:hypothetical protein EPI10_024312 [Gossypium australe]|uniref:Uncharacterized protein n=1 Tax=Gossypium australe TaxID=47621 RepID=A0A5B6VYR5_9ROSI|nr:hypothetical protein EPI10_024312 [Gossypium australe]